MGANAMIRQDVLDSGAVGLTGAAPQTAAGKSLTMNSVAVGSLSATIRMKATTNTLTITPNWQVSNDGTTWRDCYGENRAAFVIGVTGTGSAVSATINIQAPNGVYGHRFARIVGVSGTGVGAGAGTDEIQAQYSFRLNQL